MNLLIHNYLAPYRLFLFRKLVRDYNFVICLIDKTERGRIWNTSDSNDYLFPYNVKFKSIYIWSGIFKLLFSKFKKNRPSNLIIAEGSTGMAIILFIIVTITNLFIDCNIILWSESSDMNHSFLRSCIRKSLYEQLIYPQIDTFIALGQDTADYLYRLKYDAPIITTHQFYPVKHISRHAFYKLLSNRMESRYFNILAIGSLSERKNFKLILEAIADIKTIRPVNIFIMGDGPQKKLLQDLAHKKGINLTLLGHKTGKDKRKILSASHVLVLPSLCDPWGLVVNEAMSFGLPVVISDKCGAKMLVGPSNGLVISPNSNALSAIKGYLQNLESDRSLYLAQSEASYNKLVYEYNYKSFINSFIRSLK